MDGQEGSYLHLTVCSNLSWVRGFVSCDGHWYFIQPRSEATPTSGRAELVVYQPHELVGGDGQCEGAADGQALDDHPVVSAGGPSRGNLWLYPVVDSEFIAINPDNWYDRMIAQLGNVASRIGPFVIDSMIGVAIDELPTRLTLLGNYPNPFNPSTTIEYAVPSTRPLRLTVYDLRGRPQRVLVNEDRVAGVHVATWDGRDAGGR